MPGTFRHTRRVQFYETDQAAVVHFSTYFRYLEEAEHAWWRRAGLPAAAHHTSPAFHRETLTIEYRAPLRFEDVFEVALDVEPIAPDRLRYRAAITRGTVAIATATWICVRPAAASDGTTREVARSDEIAARLAASAATLGE